MTYDDWVRVIDQAADAGVNDVQFIGGEPTLHPHLTDLIGRALDRRLRVEVFSNLYRVTPAMWEVLSRPGVSLATSYYSDDSAEHDAIVARRGAYARTRANIVEALRRDIPLRTGVIDVRDGQRVSGALRQLERLGVTNVGNDRLRQVGRGERDRQASTDQLCGNCASGVLAVSASGDVWPCVFTRWLPVGNVRASTLAQILAGDDLARTANDLQSAFAARRPSVRCGPDACNPQCGPSCGPACGPQGTRTPCKPNGGCSPDYGKCEPDTDLCQPQRECMPNACRPTS